MTSRNTQNSARAAANDDATSTPPGDDNNALRLRVDALQRTITEYGADLQVLQRSVGTHDTRLTSIDDKLTELLIRSREKEPSSPSQAETTPTASDSAQPTSAAQGSGGDTTPRTNTVPPHLSTPPPSQAPTSSSARSRAASITFTDPVTSDIGTNSGGGGKINFSIKPEELGTFDGTPEDTELFISNIDAIYQSEPDASNLPAWEKAILRALPRTMRDEARLWFASLGETSRKELRTLRGETGWFEQLRAAFKPAEAVVRLQARDRTWDPDRETISHYIFAKVALLKAGWPKFTDLDCIADVVAGTPAELARTLRVPHLKKKVFDELRQEMRVQEEYWREIYNRPLTRETPSDAVSTKNRAPTHGILAQPLTATPSAYAQASPRPPAPPTFGRGARRGKSIRSDFYPARLSYGVNPSTGQRNMTYKVPDTDETMWCVRSCRICKGDHFDFAHDYCSSNIVHTATVEDEDDYPVTVGNSHF
ncbi:hypothetical protein CF326_g8856 [Tilletia indica]|nr:hypothetical protein CF326_g8856 [Tilletia indica]